MTDKIREILEGMEHDVDRLQDMLTYENYVEKLEEDYQTLYDLAESMLVRLSEWENTEDYQYDLKALYRLFGGKNG